MNWKGMVMISILLLILIVLMESKSRIEQRSDLKEIQKRFPAATISTVGGSSDDIVGNAHDSLGTDGIDHNGIVRRIIR